MRYHFIYTFQKDYPAINCLTFLCFFCVSDMYFGLVESTSPVVVNHEIGTHTKPTKLPVLLSNRIPDFQARLTQPPEMKAVVSFAWHKAIQRREKVRSQHPYFILLQDDKIKHENHGESVVAFV